MGKAKQKQKERGQFNKQVNIQNRKASYEFHFIEKLVAGIVLTGSEIKAIRQNRASLQEAYCYFHEGELWVKQMHISPYQGGSFDNHEPTRQRKLLLKQRELRKLRDKVEAKGHTIVPVRLFINDRGLAKVEVALAKGKNLHDKRQAIKEKELKREMNKALT